MIWNTCWTCGQSSWATNIALRNNIDVRNFESRQQPAGMHAFNNFPIMYELSGCPVIVIKRWTALTLSLQPCPNLQDPPSYMAWHQITRNKPQYGTYRRVRSQNLVAALFPVSIGARKRITNHQTKDLVKHAQIPESISFPQRILLLRGISAHLSQYIRRVHDGRTGPGFALSDLD